MLTKSGLYTSSESDSIWRKGAMMELIRGLHNLRPRHRGCVLTIGVFDGVHIGHQAMLERLAALGHDCDLPAVLMMFEPQPQETMPYLITPARLTPFREKIRALSATAVDRVLCVRFNESFAQLSAMRFIEDILVAGLGAQHVVVGDDFEGAGCGVWPLMSA